MPFMFTYGKVRGNEVLKDKSLNLLEELPPESNSIVKGFESIGIKADNSFFSQALVQPKTSIAIKEMPVLPNWYQCTAQKSKNVVILPTFHNKK